MCISELEVQCCTQIISDYSHVCDLAEISLGSTPASELTLLCWSRQADLAGYARKARWLYFGRKMLKVCHYKNVFDFLTSPATDGDI